MPIEPEEELREYRAILRDLTQKDPEIKRDWQRLLKRIRPQALTPEIDADERISKQLATEKKELQDRIEKLEQDRLQQELSSKYNAQKEKLSGPPFNFDADDIAAVEQLIKDKEFPSYELAAEYYQKVNAPARPSGLGLGGTTRSKSVRQQRKEFNDRFRGVFKRPGQSKWQETFDDAYGKVMSGQYLKE